MPCFYQFADNPFVEHGILLTNDNGLEHGRQILQQISDPVTAGQTHGFQHLVLIFGLQASPQQFDDGRIIKLNERLNDLPSHRPLFMMKEVFQGGRNGSVVHFADKQE